MRTCLILIPACVVYGGMELLARGQPALLPTCSARDYGAAGDGVTDDRAALQAALDACTVVNVPAGHYLVSKGSGAWNLNVGQGRSLIGAGQASTILVQTVVPGSVRLLQVAAGDVTIADLTLDGNKSVQTADEHRAGVFATTAPRVTLRRVTAQNFTGDGFYIYNGSNDSVVDHVTAIHNDRNGITYGGGTTGGTVTGSLFQANRAQQFDSEPGSGGTVNGLIISGSTFDTGGVSNDYVLTMSGSGSSSRSSGWVVTGNTINGGATAVWLDSSIIANNTGTNSTTKPCYTVYRRSVGDAIVGNSCLQTQTTVDNLAGVWIVGTGATDMPEAVTVADNTLRVTGAAKSFGVLGTGVVSVAVLRNTLIGPGLAAAGYAGVFMRSTILGSDFRTVIVDDNVIRNWGNVGVHLSGNITGVGTAIIDSFELRRNAFSDDSSPSTQTHVLLEDAGGVPTTQTRSGNTCSGGTSCSDANQ